MLLLNRKTRKSIGILSAGAAALLITGLGVANSRADTLVWNPSQSTTGGSNGAGTWNSSGTYSTTSLGVSNSGNSYVLDGGGGTVTASGQMLVNGNLTLQNITLNNTAYTSNSSTTTGISQVALGAALNINSGATLNGTDINAGGINGTGVINVNSGGTLSESTRIQINYGPGTASGDEINVNSGSVTMSGGIAFLSDSALANSAGVMTVGADGTGGTVTVKQFGTGGSGSGQQGILNIDSGTVTATDTPSITAGGTGNTSLVTTVVNLNGGVLSVHDITESLNKGETATNTTIVNFNGGTLQENNASIGIIGNPSSSTAVPTNLNVLSGGAVVDTNGYSPVIYNPLLNGTGGSADGGLTVENSNPTRGGISLDPTTGALTIKGGLLTITGANTYTGATVVQSGAGLQLEDHNTTNPYGGVTGVATIADSSMLQIDSGAALVLNPDGVGTQISVKGLNLQGGIISLAFDGATVQNLLVGSAAAVSGTNTIILSDLASATPVPDGTYTLIADAAGGLNGTFEFANGLTTDTLTFGTNTYTGTLNDSATALTVTVSAVPEPTAVALLAVGAMGLLLLRRRKPAA